MSRHSRRRRALVTGTAVGIGWLGSLSVAACSGDPDQPAASVTPAASTPSVPGDSTEPVQGPSAGTSEPQEPLLPAAARGDSVRSAKAFVEYYIDLLNYASLTGDTRTFDRVATGACTLCTDYSNLFHSTWDDGGFLHSKGLTIRRLGATFSDGTTLSLALVVRAAPTRLKQSASESVSVAPAERLSFAIDVEGESMTWRVTRFEVT
ncbi:MAG: DUF6318 family protein [Actinomycetota bacterium]|nr:DUF6318 family protein [Actinomycetota bacterium]